MVTNGAGRAPAQAQVQAVLDELTAAGPELGFQVAVFQHGHLVVDACSGWADAARSRPVDADTLFTVYSVSKAITATAVHRLAERGVLDLEQPIAMYWPEFGANGKELITPRQVLLHTAGLMNLPAGTTPRDHADWASMLARMETMEPALPPGSLRVYHAMTQGWILGGLVEKITGVPLAEFVENEFALGLGLETLAMGLPAAKLPRVATLVEAPGLKAAPPRPFPETVPTGVIADDVMNQDSIRQACLPAYGMITNARSLAGFFAGLIGDGLDGARVLGPRQSALATAEAMNAPMQPGDPPTRTGLGYALGGDSPVLGPRVSAFGHGGYGGSVGMADPELGLAIAITKNYLSDALPEESPTARIAATIRAAFSV